VNQKVRITVLGSLVLVVGLAFAALQDPLFELRWGPLQSFAPVPAALQPEPAPAWTTSVRPLGPRDVWPELSEAFLTFLQEDRPIDFPVLVPQNFTESSFLLGASHFRLERLDHGYYAIFQSTQMEIMILGTAQVHHSVDQKIETVQNDYLHAFQDPGPRPAGGRITFGAYGADYSVTFDCKVSEPTLGQNCVTASQAKTFAQALISGAPTALIPPDFEGS
jgi:hypothetical protein